MKTLFSSIFLFLTGISLGIAQSNYQDLSWPREIKTEKATVTLYQPQLEVFEGNKIDGRMAVSIKANDELVFGAVWINAVASTDMDERTVTLESIHVPRINFPGLVDEEKTLKFSTILEDELESWDIVMSLDRLIASMSEIEKLHDLSSQLDNTPPAIYFRTSPTNLISIDGDPIYKKDDDFSLEYIVNTAFFIVKSSTKYYIKDGKFWYESSEELTGFSPIDAAPKNIQGFADKYGGDIILDSIDLAIEVAPDLLLVTKPSEIISTDGEPDYQSIEGTSLLYAVNSEDDILMDIDSQEHYILIAGRWYHSKNLKDGDWKFQEPDDLPEDFANIPEESDMANVRVSVPNTDEAINAVLEQSIPQTAKVDRKTATVEVSYDGDPQFESITGTNMSYAVNTDKTVLLIDSDYYCVDDAIWFISSKATGPWEVSVERPDEVDNIPPESPVYNVKYVYIYDSTPEVVYVGYYPGYTYSYVYGGVVVYGTGYYYPYWYGSYYYPRPVTYGYGVHYSPYRGWGFSIGISVGWGYHPRGYWGARGYHHGYRHGYNRGYHHGYNNGYRHGYNQGAKRGYAAGKKSNNIYSNRGSGVKQTGNQNRTPSNKANNTGKTQASNKQNNMYTDKNGGVHQQNKDGSWENKSNSNKVNQNTGSKQNNMPENNRSNSNTKNSTTKASYDRSNSGASKNNSSNRAATSNQQSSRSQSSQQQLDRASQNRSQGNQNYNRSNTNRSSGASRSGGGGGRSGGGRRR